ncbi:MAG: zinc ABC transporter substrate-binding protein [Clostridiaceae bacterium]|nr:zinc ABC transporter substrate-binding protein [Clostridiaceae bacterium]
MKKITYFMLFITFILFLGLGVFSDDTPADTVDMNNEDTQRELYLNIMTTNKLEYDMVKTIVGDKHNVAYMFTEEGECQKFKVNEGTVKNISDNMDIFFYSESELEPWSNNLIEKLNKSNVGIIDVSRGIRLLNIENDDKETVENPYYYSGIEEYKILLYNIKSAIQDRDAKNRNFYENNYNKAIEDLDKSIVEINKDKKDINKYNFISLDNDLDYLYKNLGITPIKCKEDEIENTISNNNFDKDKVIILKSNDTPFFKEGYKVASFTRYNGNKSVKNLIIDNYETFYNLIEENKNK